MLGTFSSSLSSWSSKRPRPEPPTGGFGLSVSHLLNLLVLVLLVDGWLQIFGSLMSEIGGLGLPLPHTLKHSVS